jgi:hypothetical protein
MSDPFILESGPNLIYSKHSYQFIIRVSNSCFKEKLARDNVHIATSVRFKKSDKDDDTLTQYIIRIHDIASYLEIIR